ncbi:phospholipase C type enzyme [Tulasnella sp. JGI-2019a]|nr:phospholipase C type enzyme [Tulasnella sp. JGI-2019a]
MSTEQQIKVLSFNCWGLKYVAKDRAERIRALADVLSTSNYDIIGLQELWVHADFQTIRNTVLKHLPYSKYFYSGALGSGLALFSRFPITGSSIYPYALNGSPLDVAGGDFFVGKSITSIVIEHPVLGEVEVFNTHMYARGGETGHESMRSHRIVGALQVAKCFRASARQGRYIIATGDFNSIPTSLTLDIIRNHGGVTDAFASSHDSSLFQTEGVENPQHAVRSFGVTCDSPLNSYSAGKQLDEVASKWQGKRLDYVFMRDPLHCSESSQTLVCTHSEVVLTGRVPGRNFSYSDHFGLEVTLEIRPSSRSPGGGAVKLPPELLHNGFAPSGAPSIRSVARGPSFTTATELHTGSINAAISALSVAYRQARRISNLQLAGFVGCVIAAVGLIVGSAWQPWSAINPLVVLVGVVLGWGGGTLLYAGFIFGNYETNMLVNAIEELEMLRSQRE